MNGHLMAKVCLLLLLSPFALQAQVDESTYLPRWVLPWIPGATHPAGYLEQHAPDSILVQEESNGALLLDPLRLSLEGLSLTRTAWTLEGVSVDSALHAGQAAFSLPLSPDLQLGLVRGADPLEGAGVDLRLRPRPGLHVEGLLDLLGSPRPWAPFMINTPAIERDAVLYPERRRLRRQTLFSAQIPLGWGVLLVYGMEQERRFNDMDLWGSHFDEDARRGGIGWMSHTGTEREGQVAFSFLDLTRRDNAGAEYGLGLSRTAEQSRLAWVSGWKTRGPAGWLKLSLVVEHQADDPHLPAEGGVMPYLPRDGQAIGTWTLPSRQTAMALHAAWERSLGERWRWSARLDWNHRHHRMQTPGWLGQSLEGAPFRLLVWDRPLEWVAGTDSLLNGRTGVRMALGRAASLYGGVLVSRMATSRLEARTVLGWDAHLSWTLRDSRQRPLATFHLGHHADPWDLETLDFLHPAIPRARLLGWDGADPQALAGGGPAPYLGYSGGDSHQAAEGLGLSARWRAQVRWHLKRSGRWKLDLGVLWQTWENPLRVRYGREYGSWVEREGGDRLYLLNQPVETYLLCQPSLQNRPHYGEFLLRWYGQETNRWFISFSFMAHLGITDSGVGNGPLSNDPGYLTELGADPNGLVNTYGRVEGDRAFTARLSAAWALGRGWWLGLSAKYRDGTPFAFIRQWRHGHQLVLQNQTIKALDALGSGHGPREDYVGELTLQLSREWALRNGGLFRVALVAANLLDAGYEVSEWALQTDGRRLPNEINAPPSLRLKLDWLWGRR